MTKIYILTSEHETLVCVHCPGCNMWHPFRVIGEGKPIWSWNGDANAPTFSPSMLVNKNYPSSRCHSFVENGKIRFLNDCHHGLRNQTVDLPDLDNHGDPIDWEAK